MQFREALLLIFLVVSRGESNLLLNLKEFAVEAKQILLERNQRSLWTYLESGALDDETILENKLAFKDLRIRPNVMRDVSTVSTATRVLGEQVSIPIGISPSAMHQLWHPMGELATAAGAEKLGSFIILSSASSYTLEKVAEAAPNVTKWFQMFLPSRDPADRNVTLDLMRRAEAAGFSAIVFTLDSPVPAWRYSTMKIQFDFKLFGTMANFDKYDGYVHARENRLTWEDFGWIKTLTRLPIVVKGILSREDAREAVRAGISGIIVSNHGGRQLDGAPATIEALPEIIDEVKGEVEVYLDGGIRSGKDVFKALAIGAHAVLIGRAAPWGLVVKGQDGVEEVLEILQKELRSVMGQAGCSSLTEINRKNVAHKMEYALRMLRFF